MHLDSIRSSSPNGSSIQDALSDTLASTFTRKVTSNAGWSLNAFSIALFHLMSDHGNFQEAIDAVVQHGGDTDTNMAIAGALLGGLWGKHDMMLNETTAFNAEVLEQCAPMITSRAGRDGMLRTAERPAQYQYKYAQDLVKTKLQCGSLASDRAAKRARV